MNVEKLNDFQQEHIYIPNQEAIIEQITEADNAFVPRFSLKTDEIFPDIPINEPMKYTDAIAIKAIKYGMIFLVNYKGAKDKSMTGSERVVYFMVLGKSSKQNLLLRVYHLKGWSVSNNNNTEKIWRMFRTDRILSMTFTGTFFRLAPEGYNQKDKGMVGGIIAAADFNNIRKNQEQLVNSLKIQDSNNSNLTDRTSIVVQDTASQVDILDPLQNPYISKIRDLDNLRITFLKSIYKKRLICVIGALGKPGGIIDVKLDKSNKQGNKKLGVFKVLDSITGKMFKKIKKINSGDNLYDLYIFVKKEEK